MASISEAVSHECESEDDKELGNLHLFEYNSIRNAIGFIETPVISFKFNVHSCQGFIEFTLELTQIENENHALFTN